MRSVADPGFFRGGCANSQKCYYFSSFFFAENCMKMKEFGPPGRRASLVPPPLDPPMEIMASYDLKFNNCDLILQQSCHASGKSRGRMNISRGQGIISIPVISYVLLSTSFNVTSFYCISKFQPNIVGSLLTKIP